MKTKMIERLQHCAAGVVAVLTPAGADVAANKSFEFDHMTAGILHIVAIVCTILVARHQLKKK